MFDSGVFLRKSHDADDRDDDSELEIDVEPDEDDECEPAQSAPQPITYLIPSPPPLPARARKAATPPPLPARARAQLALAALARSKRSELGATTMTLGIETSDEALMTRFQEGDRSAFTTLVRRYQGRLYNFTLRLLRVQSLAEDVVQETFVRVVQRASDFRNASKFSTWLHAIARNLCIDELRKQKLRRHASLDAPGGKSGDDDARPLSEEIAGTAPEADAERTTGGRELKERIARAVDDLPESHREVFLLREVSNLPFAEIAEIVGAPEPTVKSRMRYALERLQAALAEYEELARSLT